MGAKKWVFTEQSQFRKMWSEEITSKAVAPNERKMSARAPLDLRKKTRRLEKLKEDLSDTCHSYGWCGTILVIFFRGFYRVHTPSK